MEIIHFGRIIKENLSNGINKEYYLSSKPEGMPGWEERHYKKQLLKADYNYDLNMMYFNSLDEIKFNKYLDKIIKKYKFKECKNLKEVDNVCGVYLLVLDKFKQVYIGQSGNIKKRVYRHWSDKKSLERLIWGDLLTSIISIDSFGPLDTTRIFYIETYDTYETEEKIVSNFNTEYLLNRTAGGIGSSSSYTGDSLSAKVAVVANRKKRDYSKFIDVRRVKEILGDEFHYYEDRYPWLRDKQNKD